MDKKKKNGQLKKVDTYKYNILILTSITISYTCRECTSPPPVIFLTNYNILFKLFLIFGNKLIKIIIIICSTWY